MDATDDRLLDLLDPAQVTGLGDMDPASFRAAAHEVVDRMADYLETVEGRAVFPAIEPGSIRPSFPATPPEAPEPLDEILADFGLTSMEEP